jgi:hypothetical protein
MERLPTLDQLPTLQGLSVDHKAETRDAPPRNKQFLDACLEKVCQCWHFFVYIIVIIYVSDN